MRDLQGGSVLLGDLGRIGLCIAALFLLDRTVTRRIFPIDQTGRWFALHALANVIIVVMCGPDAWTCVCDPIAAGVGDFNRWTMYMVASIHMYHVLFFDNLTAADWVHHLLFGGVICSMSLFFTVGPGMGLFAFFVCGFPGGLDYLMLALVKLGRMASNTEKRWNARIMTWVRAPGCCLITFMFYVAILYGPRKITGPEMVAAVLAAILCFVNGQYYMQKVVGNAYEKDCEIKKTGC